MDKFSQLWTELQQNSRLPRGVLASQCEVELNEVMTQIDVMFNVKRREWQSELQSVKTRLERSERQQDTHEQTVAIKVTQIQELRNQLNAVNKCKDDMVMQYESQITSLQSSVQKLKCDYNRLQRKYQKSMSSDTAQPEYSRPTKDMGTEPEESNQNEARLSAQLHELRHEIEQMNEVGRQKDTHVTSMKATLDSVTSAHKDSLHTNERLLVDVRQVKAALKRCEVEKQKLETDLLTREARLGVAANDGNVRDNMLQQLRQNMEEKDNIIRMLTEVKNREERDGIAFLQDQLTSTKQLLLERENREKEMKVGLERTRLEGHQMKEMYERQCGELRSEIGNTKKLSEDEISRLLSEIMKLTDKYTTLENGFSAKGRAFRDELTQMVEDAYRKGVAVAELRAWAVQCEGMLRDTQHELCEKQTQLDSALSQLEDLKGENQRLVELARGDIETKRYTLRDTGNRRDDIVGGREVDSHDTGHLNCQKDHSRFCSQESLSEAVPAGAGDCVSLTEISPVVHHSTENVAEAMDGDINPPPWHNLLNFTLQSTLSLGDRPESRQSVAQQFLNEEVEHARLLREKLADRIDDLETKTMDTVNRFNCT